LPFKCNLQRYNAGLPGSILAVPPVTETDELTVVGLCTLNQVDP
jgi:hypothetical protein